MPFSPSNPEAILIEIVIVPGMDIYCDSDLRHSIIQRAESQNIHLSKVVEPSFEKERVVWFYPETTKLLFKASFIPSILPLISDIITGIVRDWIKERFPSKPHSTTVRIYDPSGQPISEVERPNVIPLKKWKPE